MGDGDEWLTMRHAATRLHVCVKTIARAIREQGLPAHRMFGRLVRIRASELDAWASGRAEKKSVPQEIMGRMSDE